MKPHNIFHTVFSLSSNKLFLLFYLLCVLSPSVSAANSDLQQLLSFKSSLLDSTQLPNWSTSNNLCEFTGVTCNINSRVVSIDLSTKKLHLDFHAVSSSLLTLPNLETLLLKNSNITGKFSLSARSQCSSVLIKLDLAENSISGPISDISSLSSCIKLKSLNLSGNLMEFPASDSKGLSFNLESLDLSYNKIVGPNFVPWLLSKGCSELSYLSLKGNKIAGSVLHIQDCKNLEFLDLSANNFSTGVPKFDDFLVLNHLDLSSNKFYGDISGPISSCKNLTFLNITHNQFGGGEIPFMPSGNLKFLYLSANGFEGLMPPHLSDLCSSLVELDVSVNSLSSSVPESFGACSSLELFDISHNNFSELGDCRSLIWMDLNTNLLNGTIPPALFKQSGNIAAGLLTEKPYGYIKNDGSKECHGAGNLLEFGGIRQKQLNRISTRYPCNLTRVYWGIREPTIYNNGSIIFLDLSYNKLEGGLPKELGSMYYIEILNLGNDLSGPIPQELGKMRYAAILDMSYNRLNGSIPQTLTGLNFLGDIDLLNNHLSGVIPESAPFDTFPEYRFLNNSGLCGYPLPDCGSGSNTNSSGQHKKSNRRQASLAGSIAMGLLFSLVCIFGFILIAVETRKRRKKKEAALEAYMESHSHSGPANSGWKLTSAREALSIELATFDKLSSRR